MHGQLLVQLLPALSDTGIASKLDLDTKLNVHEVKLVFCREISVTLSGKEIYI